MRYLNVFVTSCLLFALTACSESKAESHTDKLLASLSDIDYVNSLDFSEELMEAEFITLQDIDCVGIDAVDNYLLKGFESKLPDSSSRESLSQHDLQRIGICRSPSGNRACTLLDMLGSIERFYFAYGRFPDSSGEIMCSIIGQDRFSQFRASAAVDKFEWCLPFVNPITGRLVQSFDKEGWSPGGIWIEVLSGSEAIQGRLGAITVIPVDSDGNTMEPGELWMVTVYGESPDSEIFEFPWWRR